MTIRLVAITPKHLRLIDDNQMLLNMSHGTEAYLNTVRKEMQSDYGRVPITPNYPVRTYALSRGWEIHMDPGGFSGELVNTTGYAVFVQGPRRHGGRTSSGHAQTAVMRRRGWRSITDVARETRREYIQMVNKSIKGSVLD